MAVADVSGVQEEHDVRRQMQTLQVRREEVRQRRLVHSLTRSLIHPPPPRLKCHNKCTKDAPPCRISFLTCESPVLSGFVGFFFFVLNFIGFVP